MFIWHRFQLKTESYLCVLAVRLHYSCVFGAWKHKLLKTGFKVQLFETVPYHLRVNYKNTVMSCTWLLRIQSIGMCEFLYDVTSPTTGLACIIQHLVIVVDPREQVLLWVVARRDTAKTGS